MQLRTRNICRGLLVAATGLLIACGEKSATTEPASSIQGAANPRLTAAAEPATTDDAASLMRRANAAFLGDRILSPAGDNAVELFLKVRNLDASHPGLGEVLVEIMPLANYGFESALRNNDEVEAERLFSLLQQLNPESHVVKAAALNLDELRTRLVQRVAISDAAVNARVAALNDVKPKATTPTPAPIARAAPATSAPSIALAVNAERVPPTTAPATVKAAVVSPPPKTTSLFAPVAIAKVTPEYPPQAKRRHVEGFVELEFVVNELGATEDIRVVRSEPQGTFDRSAVRALMRWRFKPAQRDGKPEVAKTRTTVNFRQG